MRNKLKVILKSANRCWKSVKHFFDQLFGGLTKKANKTIKALCNTVAFITSIFVFCMIFIALLLISAPIELLRTNIEPIDIQNHVVH